MPTKKVSLAFVITLAIAAAVVGAAVRYLQDTRANAAPQSRPEFSLPDLQNKQHSIAEWDGKLVLINFWASWCRPCMNKMRIMQPLEEELKSKGVVFMNVSLDRNPEDWKRALDRENFVGVHLIAEGDIDSSVATDYQVRILPQYFLIDKYGNFAEKPKQFKAEGLRLVLNRLSR